MKRITLASICVFLTTSFLPAYGQQTQASAQFLADRHVSKNISCNACHGKSISSSLFFDESKKESCVKCHGFYEEVAKKTEPKISEEKNPHNQHDGNLPCTSCHKGHKKGVNYCEKPLLQFPSFPVGLENSAFS